MHSTLSLIILLLAAAVVVSALFRAWRLPSMLGFLLVGIIMGPHALNWLPDSAETRHLAEFGVVFLMFSIGLEFSLPKLRAIRTTVFGFGGAQVLSFILVTILITSNVGLPWTTGLAIGGALAMSSTAIVSKMLAEKLALQSEHGKQMIAVLLFQDLAVVPLLILTPTLATGGEDLWLALLTAGGKAVVVLLLLLFVGQKLMRPWFSWVASHKSSELFMLNVLLITLGLAYLTDQAGLSLALGAFLAGMLISETEFRYQVEDDIKPFRDVLLGLFFVTIGMLLDLHEVANHLFGVTSILIALIVTKTAIVWAIGRAFGNDSHVATRTALGLAQAGEFGFVLLAQAGGLNLITGAPMQIVLAAMVLSMMIAPLIIQNSDRITRRLCGGEWAGRARELHDIAIRSMNADAHLIVCGYGRSGQNLARLLESEDIAYIALDADPARVKAASAAGESVVFGDASKREVLMAAGLNRARGMVITFADLHASMKILSLVQEIRPDLPVIVRTHDETDLDALKIAGAAAVVPEVLEGSLMLASHALLLLGVPLSRVLKKLRNVREQRYGLLRGFFRGATDEDEQLSETAQPRLRSVLITEQADAAGKTIADTKIIEFGVEVLVVRRRNIRGLDPQPDMQIHAGDVLVLRGIPENLAIAEKYLLQGE
ncbi:MAG: cation:proton antiporter [Sulfuriferula sp.]